MNDMEFNDNASFSMEKTIGGYALTVGGKRIDLPGVSNFEWRTEGNVKIKHLYMGNETGDDREWRMNVDFEGNYRVRLQQLDPRCYLYINEE